MTSFYVLFPLEIVALSSLKSILNYKVFYANQRSSPCLPTSQGNVYYVVLEASDVVSQNVHAIFRGEGQMFL